MSGQLSLQAGPGRLQPEHGCAADGTKDRVTGQTMLLDCNKRRQATSWLETELDRCGYAGKLWEPKQ